MKKLNIENYSLQELTNEELVLINGGESGWWWVGYAAGKVKKFCSDFYDAVLKPDPNMGMPFTA